MKKIKRWNDASILPCQIGFFVWIVGWLKVSFKKMFAIILSYLNIGVFMKTIANTVITLYDDMLLAVLGMELEWIVGQIIINYKFYFQ